MWEIRMSSWNRPEWICSSDYSESRQLIYEWTAVIDAQSASRIDIDPERWKFRIKGSHSLLFQTASPNRKQETNTAIGSYDRHWGKYKGIYQSVGWAGSERGTNHSGWSDRLQRRNWQCILGLQEYQNGNRSDRSSSQSEQVHCARIRRLWR